MAIADRPAPVGQPGRRGTEALETLDQQIEARDAMCATARSFLWPDIETLPDAFRLSGANGSASNLC